MKGQNILQVQFMCWDELMKASWPWVLTVLNAHSSFLHSLNLITFYKGLKCWRGDMHKPARSTLSFIAVVTPTVCGGFSGGKKKDDLQENISLTWVMMRNRGEEDGLLPWILRAILRQHHALNPASSSETPPWLPGGQRDTRMTYGNITREKKIRYCERGGGNGEGREEENVKNSQTLSAWNNMMRGNNNVKNIS